MRQFVRRLIVSLCHPFDQLVGLPDEPAPVLLHFAYESILSGRDSADTPSKMLKCIGLFNAILHVSTEYPTVTFKHLAAHLGVTHSSLLSSVKYLRRINLVKVEEDCQRRACRPKHIICVVEPLVKYTSRCMDHSNKTLSSQNIDWRREPVRFFTCVDSRLLRKRRPTDTPSKALRCIGLFHVIVRLKVKHNVVTRPVIARAIGLTENAVASHVELLRYVDLVAVSKARSEGQIGYEHRIYPPYELTEETRRTLCSLKSALQGCGLWGS